MPLDQVAVEEARIHNILDNADPFTLMFEMTTSKKIDKLLKAFVACKKEIGTVVMQDMKNPHFKNQFSSLKECWLKVHEPLVNNSLVFTQWPTGNFLVNWLAHESGEYMVGKYKLALAKPGPQEQGSNISYAKRYSLCAIFGITGGDVEDDGEMAMGRSGSSGSSSQKGTDPFKGSQKSSSFKKNEVNTDIPF